MRGEEAVLMQGEDSVTGLYHMAGQELAESMHILKSIMGKTEEEFLMLGRRAASFLDSSEKIVGMANSVVDLVSGENVSTTISRLQDLMERVTGYIKASDEEIEANISILQDILGVINSMLTPLSKLQAITRKLRALGISTMIQHASLRNASEGFRVLGDDIRNLSEIVTLHSRSTIHEIEALKTLIKTSVSRLRALREGQQEKASAVIRRTMGSVDSLNDKYRDSMQAVRDIAIHYDNVIKNIRQVIMMLQFHDISRQQFEAVYASCGEIAKQLPSRAGAGAYASQEGEAGALARDILHFCRARADEVQQTREEFLSAVENLKSSSTAIANNIIGVVRKTGLVAAVKETAIESFLSHVEATLSSVSKTLSVLSENALIRKELSESVNPVVDITAEISSAMQEIRNIGSEIQFISLNSTIKSTHVGRAGRGLAVISLSIQSISSETHEITGLIGSMLTAVSGHVAELARHMESHALTRDTAVHEMTDDLSELIRSLREANASVGISLDDIDRMGLELSRDISTVVREIWSGREIDSASAAVLAHFGALRKYCEGYLLQRGDILRGEDDPRGLSREGSAKKIRPYGEFGENVELF